MRIPVAFSILVFFVAFRNCYSAKQIENNSVDHGAGETPLPPQSTTEHPDPDPKTTTVPTTTTTIVTTTTSKTSPKPPTPAPTTPSTSTPAPPPPPTTPTTTAPTTTAPPSSTSPSTTPLPHPTTTQAPHPSERKFDAMSFLGGFALGLGLVAIGILSWKFYLSRQENYYHTL